MLLVSVAYVAVMTVATMFAFAWDKLCAQSGRRRIAENTLLSMAAVGGSLGAIAAQQILRHKTRKEPFRTQLYVIAGIQCLVLAALSLQPFRDAVWGAIRQLAD